MILRTVFTSFLLASLLAGCNTQQPQTQPQPQPQTEAKPAASPSINSLYQSEKLEGKAIRALSKVDNEQQFYAITSETQGLTIIDKQGKTISTVAGHFAGIDGRSNYPLQQQQEIIATVESETNSLHLFQWTALNQQLTPLYQFQFTEFQAENLCLYQNRDSNHLYAFLLTPYGAAEQWLLIDGIHKNIEAVKVRDIKIGTESEFCSVDDLADTVYFSEEAVGIWQYPAAPESKNYRSLVAGLAPNGHLQRPVAAIQVLESGRLAAMETGDDTIPSLLHIYQMEDQAYSSYSTYSLSDQREIESISTYWQGEESLQIAFYESEADTFKQTQLNLFRIAAPEPNPRVIVNAVAETPPVDRSGDAADDPAIWVNPDDASRSLIIGTHKRLGLLIYDIEGNEKQTLEVGRLNNVDLRYGFKLGEGQQLIDLIAASNRTNNHVSLFSVSAQTEKVQWIGEFATNLNDVYGICMSKDQSSDQFYVFINDKDGRFQQYEVVQQGTNYSGKLVREFSLQSQPEGCVANDETNQLFMGEEDIGVWTISADPKSNDQPQLIAKVGDHLTADVEGLALYHGDKSYLVVSSQGNNSYVLFNPAPPYSYVGSFRVALNGKSKIDGTSDTDGLEVTSANLGGLYSEGMLVIQDGFNVMPPQPQNFKIVPWTAVKEGLDL